MAYTFNTLPSGKVQILENGKDISGRGYGFEASYAASLGYKAPTPTPTPTPPATSPSPNLNPIFTGYNAPANQPSYSFSPSIQGAPQAVLENKGLSITEPYRVASGTIQPGASVLRMGATSKGDVSIKNPDGSQLLISPKEYAGLTGQALPTPQTNIQNLAQQIAESSQSMGVPLTDVFLKQFPQFGGMQTSPTKSTSPYDASLLGTSIGSDLPTPTINDYSTAELGSYDSTIKEFEKQKKEQTADLIKLIKGSTPDYAALSEKVGLTGATQQLKDVRLQIADKEGLIRKTKEQVSQQPIQTAFIQGQQAQIDRLNSIDLLNLRAKEAVLVGSVNTAETLINRAIDLQYKDTENQIQVRKLVLDNIQDSLTGAEKKKADAQKRMFDLQLKYIDLEKDELKEDNKRNHDLIKDLLKVGGNAGLVDLSKSYLENASNPAIQAALKKATVTTVTGELTPKQTSIAIQLTNSLKTNPAYTDMLDISTGISGVQTGLSQKNGFGDITAINAFQRMVDPGATVRSEDVTLLQSASGFIDKILSTYPIERLRQGDKLPETVRQRMLKTAQELYEARRKNYESSVSNIKNLARANNIDFSYIGTDFPALTSVSKVTNSTSQSSKINPKESTSNDPLGIR